VTLNSETSSLLKKVAQLDLIQQSNFVTNLPPSLNILVGAVRVHKLGSTVNLHIDVILPSTPKTINHWIQDAVKLVPDTFTVEWLGMETQRKTHARYERMQYQGYTLEAVAEKTDVLRVTLNYTCRE
jgi:hypothetical protein